MRLKDALHLIVKNRFIKINVISITIVGLL